MSLSLYDVSVGSYLQILNAASGFLAKGREHLEKNGVDLKDMVETKLIADMLPFRFQVVSVAHHSLGAVRALETGIFTPPSYDPSLDYAALEKLVAEARAGIEQYSREAIDSAAEKDVVFKLGERSMPFVGANFILSFSLPNFYFHAATAYDILRSKGVPIGKRDFMGVPRIKR